MMHKHERCIDKQHGNEERWFKPSQTPEEEIFQRYLTSTLLYVLYKAHRNHKSANDKKQWNTASEVFIIAGKPRRRLRRRIRAERICDYVYDKHRRYRYEPQAI